MNAAEVTGLTYTFGDNSKASLVDINLTIPWNTRTLVVGCNGAGKSTLLKLISGRHLVTRGTITVAGTDPFSVAEQNSFEANGDGEECSVTTYLGTDWCHMEIINRDIRVDELLNSIGYERYRKRADLLIDILEVDLNWRMFLLSDGQKRRVQLIMGLLKPFRVLLLDEVTVDLDVIGRTRLLQFLKEESEQRKCSIVYATHIFDGLAAWPTQILHINDGKIVNNVDCSSQINFTDAHQDHQVQAADSIFTINRTSSLHPLALHWLTNDTQQREN